MSDNMHEFGDDGAWWRESDAASVAKKVNKKSRGVYEVAYGVFADEKELRDNSARNFANKNMMPNVFTLMHRDAGGIEIPLVGMEDGHLLAVIRMMLMEWTAKEKTKLINDAMRGYAKPEMNPVKARLLNLTVLDEKEFKERSDSIEKYMAEYTNMMYVRASPYVLVAILRPTLNEQVMSILRTVFPFDVAEEAMAPANYYRRERQLDAGTPANNDLAAELGIVDEGGEPEQPAE